MDEQVIDDLYNRAKGQGYTKSRDEFIKLLHNDTQVFNDMYSYVKTNGYQKDENNFASLVGKNATAPATPEDVKKKGQSATTVSRSEDTSLGLPTEQTPQVQPKKIPQPEEEGVLSKIGNAALKAQSATMLAAKKTADVTTGLASSAWKWFLETSDNIVNAEKNMLKQGGFFDEDMPETDKPISDALKQQLEKAKTKGESPLDPRVIISSIATIANKVINSALPEKQRNEIINRLAIASNNIQSDVIRVEAYQEKTLPKNIPTEIAKNIIGMAPELILAGKMAGPAAAESKAAEWTKKATEKATPFIRDNAPKAAKVLEESIVAPFTKIMATGYAVKSMADTKEGENVFWNGVEGAAKGTVEGMYMHGLGMAAGEVTKPVSKFISKSGINSAIATAIASPLSNAGVFTTAKALRTAATEQRFLTAEEVAMEAGTGAGFSLLHLKSQFDTHNEANHYYENVLNDDKQYSFSRVLNETKSNLDLAYNPELTPEKVADLEEARDEIKKAILREPDLKKKQMLGNEAVKIQNQLDAHNNIQSIVEDKDFIVSRINEQDDLSDQQKTFFINKINAIADNYDMSEFAVKKRELNTKIDEAQKKLDDSAEVFTNLKSPSDRIKAKIDVDNKRKELEDLNNQLTELITNKANEDAIQKQKSNESVLLSEQPELGLQEVDEGDTQPEVTTGEEVITTEGEKEVEAKKAEIKKLNDEIDSFDDEYNSLADIVNNEDRKIGTPKSENEIKLNELQDKTNALIDERNKIEQSLKEPAPEITFQGKRGQADSITFDGKTVKQGEEIDLSDVNISQDDTMPDLRSGKYKVRMLSVDVNGKKATLTLTDGNEVITTTVKDLRDSELKKIESKPASPEAQSLADKIRTAKVGKGKAFDAILGIPVAIWDGSVELVAKTVEAGKSLGDAIKAGIKYIEANHKGKFDAKEYEREIKAGFISGYKEAMQGLQEDVDFASRRKKLWEDRIVELTASHDKYKETDKYKKGDAKDTEYKKKIEEAKAERDTEQGNIDNAIDKLKDSDVYKNANSIEKEELVRDVRERFDIKEKKAPSPEKLLGQKNSKEIKTTIKKYMTEISKAAKQGAKSVKDRIAEATKKIEDYFQSVKEYGNLTRKDLNKIRKIMSNVGETEASLDKAVDKINDVIDNAKTDTIEISQAKILRNTMKELKASKKSLDERRKVFAAAIKNIEKSGSITTKQADALINKINKVNVESDEQMEKVIEYAEKVFADAEYDNKLTKANDLRSSLIKLSKSEIKDPYLKELATKFANIKPSMVDDIDAYNDMASKVKESLKGSKIVGGTEGIRQAEMVSIKDVNEYIDDVMQTQRQKVYDEKLAAANEAFNTDLTGITYEELVELMESTKEGDETKKKEKETIIRDAIKRMFNSYSAIVDHIITKGTDPFTGDPIDVSDSKKELLKKFMNMDVSKLEAKDALNTVDSLMNFIQNGSTSRMEKVVEAYTGKENIENLVKENNKRSENKKVIAKPLKLFFSKYFGKLFGQQFTNENILLDKMFKGESKSREFSKASGITEFKNKKTYVQTVINKIINDYSKSFYKTKTNGEDFRSQANIVERGMIADLKRNVVGSNEQQQAEFNRKKKIIEQSIKALENGNEKEQKLAQIYQKVYDKIVDKSKDINDVLKKSDNNNVKAVDWWVKKWDSIYDQLKDVSENVHNEILDKELDYTTRKYSKLSEDGTQTEIPLGESLFFGNNNEYVYKKKTGVLEKVRPSDELPMNDDREPTMYRDFSFDKSQVNAMQDALMDINTSGLTRRMESFFKSKDLKKVIPETEDRKILFQSVQDLVRNARNKQVVNSDEITKFARKLNSVSSIGVASALGGVLQIPKQTVGVAFNTLINTKGKLDLLYHFNQDKIDFLNKIGYGISVRGAQSLADVQSLNKVAELASKTTPEKGLEIIEKASQFWLRTFLEKPDRWIARASWLSYYEAGLKKQGKDAKNIDYSKHEVDADAAEYAQRMVDRQQNVSDKDLQGKFFRSKDTKDQLISKVLMPFANFRMNQSMRMMSDITTFTSKTASAEDRASAAKSLVGFGVEIAAFKFIATGASMLLGSATKALMGEDETEEEYEKRKANAIKSQVTGTVSDVFSPIPILDYPTVYAVDKVIDLGQSLFDVAEEDKARLFTRAKSSSDAVANMVKSLGVLGIAAGKANDLVNIIKLSTTGNFKDEYGRDKYISQPDQEALKTIGLVSFVSNFGLLPAEANAITRNAISYAKKNASTKEGGKSEEDIYNEAEQKYESEQNKQEAEGVKSDKVDILEKLLKSTGNPKKKAAIRDMIYELSKTAEDEKYDAEARKQEIREDKEEMDKLLEGYDNREDMKRYAPDKYEKNFGEDSKYYKEHMFEIEVEKQLNSILKEKEDKEQGYIKGKKKSKKSWDYGGSSSYTKTVRDAQGNVIRSYKKTKKW